MTAAVATIAQDRPPIPPSWLVAAYDAVKKEQSTISWAAVARRIEVGEGTVYKWRTGRSPINRMAWLACLAALGLPSTWVPGDPVPK